MINYSDDYNSVKPARYGQELPPGGYVCIVKSVEQCRTKKGTPQMKFTLDIAEGEFARFFEGSQKPPTFYQVMEDADGKLSGYFKALIEDFETSNSDFNSNRLNFDARQLVNKKIGFLFRLEEWIYNGNVYSAVKPVYFTTVEKIRSGKFKIPPDRTVEESYKAQSSAGNATPPSNTADDSSTDDKNTSTYGNENFGNPLDIMPISDDNIPF